MNTLPMNTSLTLGRTPGALPWLWKWTKRRLQPTSPSPSPSVRNATAEANAVRELALQARRHDPRFADDLFAAADRHERLNG